MMSANDYSNECKEKVDNNVENVSIFFLKFKYNYNYNNNYYNDLLYCTDLLYRKEI